jgi:uncharacterized protein YndB with AHSA1/START domain
MRRPVEYGTIEREIHIDASPEIVFEVISTSEHLKEWWPDDAVLEPMPGAVGELVFGDRTDPAANVVPMTVVEVDPPHRFSFRWTHGTDEVAAPGNSLLVTFELSPAGSGTALRMTEVGFREMGWEVALLEEQYQSHVQGWNQYIPALGEYVTRLVANP